MVGFLIVYLFPIQLHLKSILKYHQDKPEEYEGDQGNQAPESNVIEPVGMNIQNTDSLLGTSDNQPPQMRKNISSVEMALMYILLLFGISLAVI